MVCPTATDKTVTQTLADRLPASSSSTSSSSTRRRRPPEVLTEPEAIALIKACSARA